MPREIPEVMIDVLIAEALGEGDDGIAQVAQVMFNRSDSRGQTLEQVVTAPKQFEGYKSPGREVKKAMENEQVRQRVKEIARQVDYGEYDVPYPGADHFHTPQVKPSWSKQPDKIQKDGSLGNHIFYSTPRSRRVAEARPQVQQQEQQQAQAPTPPAPTVDRSSPVPTPSTTTAQAYAPTPPPRSNDALEGIESSFGTSRSPFTPGGRQNLEESRSAELKYNMQGKRNLTVKQTLENDIIDAVTDVYGPGYTVSVISGRQQKGVSKGMVGTRRHNTAAADVHVYDSNGKRVAGDALVPLAQYWLAEDKGSIGFPARPGQSMHMDHFGGGHEGGIPLKGKETKLWFYGNPSRTQRKALEAGRDQRKPPEVLAKNAPRPPEAGAAARARLSSTSNLNTPEESDSAARASTGNPRLRAEILRQGNEQVAKPIQASEGSADVMKQFRQPSTQTPPTAQPQTTKPVRGRKRDEMEDPALAGIGAQQTPAPTQAVQPPVDTQAPETAPATPESPNIFQSALGTVQDRVGEAVGNAQQKVQDFGEGVKDFANDPKRAAQRNALAALGTLRTRGIEMGNRVRDRLKPLADFLEGPEYQEVTPNEGFRNQGSNLIAVGPSGTRRVNVDYSDRDRRRDEKAHPGMNMAGYRANKAIFDKYGMDMTASNARELQRRGETFYVPTESEDKYSGGRRGSSGTSKPPSTTTPRKRRTKTPDPKPKQSAMDRRREEERERRREQRRRDREAGRNSGI